MTTSRGFLPTFAFSLIRLSAIVAPAVIVPAIPNDPFLAEALVKQWLALFFVLVTWNMAEGTAILWIKAKSEVSEKTRTYLLITIIFAALTVAFLQYLRTLSNQGVFLLVLAILSIRGMSRTGWENERPLAGFLGAILGNSLIALISLLFIAPAFYWQSIVTAIAIGTAVGAVEASWHAEAFSKTSARWPLPLFRLALCLGPVIIATMGMSNQLPQSYLLSVLTVLAAGQVIKRTNNDGKIPNKFLLGAAGIYLLFLTIMGLCRAYESGLFT
jgi:hypothetical protein